MLQPREDVQVEFSSLFKFHHWCKKVYNIGTIPITIPLCILRTILSQILHLSDPPELIISIGTNIYHHKAVLSSLENGDPASSMNTGVPVSISSDVSTGNTDFKLTFFSTEGMLVLPPTLLPLTKLELDKRQIQMHKYNQSRLS